MPSAMELASSFSLGNKYLFCAIFFSKSRPLRFKGKQKLPQAYRPHSAALTSHICSQMYSVTFMLQVRHRTAQFASLFSKQMTPDFERRTCLGQIKVKDESATRRIRQRTATVCQKHRLLLFATNTGTSGTEKRRKSVQPKDKRAGGFSLTLQRRYMD